jgi:hypothetical protein
VTYRAVYRHVLICDGCEAELPEAATATESRAAAYVAGWRFPSRVKVDGKPAMDSSDVCPACLPNWTPQQALRGKRPA